MQRRASFSKNGTMLENHELANKNKMFSALAMKLLPITTTQENKIQQMQLNTLTHSSWWQKVIIHKPIKIIVRYKLSTSVDLCGSLQFFSHALAITVPPPYAIMQF